MNVRTAPARRADRSVALIAVLVAFGLCGTLVATVAYRRAHAGAYGIADCNAQLERLGLALDTYRNEHRELPPDLHTLTTAMRSDGKHYCGLGRLMCPSERDGKPVQFVYRLGRVRSITGRDDPDAARQVVAYCPNHLRNGLYVALNTMWSAQTVPARAANTWRWKDGRWMLLGPTLQHPPVDASDVVAFAFEYWPAEAPPRL
jgi:hypothetical protein